MSIRCRWLGALTNEDRPRHSGRSSKRVPNPARTAARASPTRRRNSGWFSSLYSNQSSSVWNPIKTPAGLPCRVIRISRSAASLRYRERSSLTLARATRRGWGSLFREPGFGLFLRDDGKDFDRRFRDVIENPHILDPEPILRPIKSSQVFDPAPAQLGRLMAQVQLDGVPDIRPKVGAEGPQALDGLGGQDDLERHLARL
jgi:hypothetical protein